MCMCFIPKEKINYIKFGFKKFLKYTPYEGKGKRIACLSVTLFISQKK